MCFSALRKYLSSKVKKYIYTRMCLKQTTNTLRANCTRRCSVNINKEHDVLEQQRLLHINQPASHSMAVFSLELKCVTSSQLF